jgi:hypothetical protein
MIVCAIISCKDMSDEEPLKGKADYSNREHLLLQNDLNILSNRQRSEKAEIMSLKNMIALLIDAISRNVVSLGVGTTAKEIEIKLRQIEEEIRNMRFDYDRKIKEQHIQKMKFKKGNRLLPSGVTKFNSNKIDDEVKLKEINLNMLKIRREYEAEMREKDLEKRKLEETRRALHQNSARKESNKSLDESKLRRLNRLLEEKEEDCRKREILIRDLKQKLRYI